jgi:hypothetical protein
MNLFRCAKLDNGNETLSGEDGRPAVPTETLPAGPAALPASTQLGPGRPSLSALSGNIKYIVEGL